MSMKLSRRGLFGALVVAASQGSPHARWVPPGGAVPVVSNDKVIGWRVPKLHAVPGGDFQAVNICGGDLGRGSFDCVIYDLYDLDGKRVAYKPPKDALPHYSDGKLIGWRVCTGLIQKYEKGKPCGSLTYTYALYDVNGDCMGGFG